MKSFAYSLKKSCSLLLVLSLVLLFSCSQDSGSGESSIRYKGLTTQAEIDEQNAESLVTSAYENGSSGKALSEMSDALKASLTQSSFVTLGIPRLLRLTRFIENTLESSAVENLMASSTASHHAVNSGTIVEEDDFGGTFTLKISFDEDSGELSAYFGFDHYHSAGLTLDGFLKLEGQFDFAENTFASLDFRFRLTTASVEESVTLQGDMSILYTSTEAEMFMDVLLRDNTTEKVYWVNDYTWTVTTDGDTAVEISGTFYHPDYGSVSVITVAPFIIEGQNDGPSSGILVATGKDNSKARLTVLSTVSFTIEVDADGDDTYESIWTVSEGL